MRFRTGVLVLAALAAALIAPPVAAAAAPMSFHPTADSLHEPTVSVRRTGDSLHQASFAVATPESVRVYLLTQLEVPDSLGRDSVRLHAHVERGITALMIGLTAVNVPVYSGMVFVRDHDVARVSPTQCPDSVRPALRRLDRASWAALALPPNRPAPLRYARR